MFRSIQNRVQKRADVLKKKTNEQSDLEKVTRAFLAQEFGTIGETLDFKVSRESKKLYISLQNKTAANELVLRSTKFAEALKAHHIHIEVIAIR